MTLEYTFQPFRFRPYQMTGRFHSTAPDFLDALGEFTRKFGRTYPRGEVQSVRRVHEMPGRADATRMEGVA